MSGANGHPGLSFGLRRSFPPPHNPANNKPSPSLPQHASPYPPHAYQHQQHQQHPPSQYSHHLFTPTSSQIPNVASLQNAVRPPPSHTPPALPGPRQRAPPPRQMLQQQQQQQQHNTPPLSYLQQSLNPQPMGQQSMASQALSQQSLSQQSLAPQSMTPQSMAPQSMTPQSLNPQPMNPQQLSQPSLGQQSLGQSPLSQQLQQPMSQPPMSQPPMAPSMTQSMSQQSMSQAPIAQSVHSVHSAQHSDTSILSQQSTPHPPAQPTLPPAQPQIPQTQQVQKLPQVQQQVPQLPQVQPVQQQPAARQTASAEPVPESHQDDDMDVGSHDESAEGDTSLEPKLIDNSPFVPRQPMGNMMSAPPEGGSFPTLEAVHKHVLSYCTSVGYAVVIGRSKRTVPGLKKVLFVCDRAGKPPSRVSPEMRKRKTTSRKCDCPFGFFAIEQRTQWTVRYRPHESHLKHNHGPSESPLLHPAARKLDSKMVAAVKKLKDDGVGVSQTLEILQNENPHVPLLPRDIYNARAAINRNPQKVATGLAENRPAIYSKPHPSAEERIRADLRRELATAREELEKVKKDSDKEIENLKGKLREKDKIIEKFEQFIDICNQRVMVSLSNKEDSRGAVPPAP
ncbi:hypothetical protein C8A00DRAFT_31741 [Chaetomidium leptoderma]|uniref:Uncharacterized protein n=1 Tax=Chaetomidium leptoderma TaxID=669021 RepID=A0AAN6ZZ06_9PEZI|nr:hypothetical protein C8A00DRAFT_31741 [Chaetomidium leptoderma]